MSFNQNKDVAIDVENLSKCYHIYAQPHDRLKQMALPRIQKMIGVQPRKYHRDFWAMSNVSLEVNKGETIGVIGRNGSGKSTLLQMICGTLNPTSGNIKTNGRIAALLELGSGFNPEFTGRENVFMNAAVLGLSQEEIERRFDNIAAFAEIGDFIEQPVKTYSSGMMVRLAFAVIAHVDADILVVDEALAVGDAVFTQKCMRFIRKFKEKGTLLFVSHDMSSVLNLCERALWLHEGQVRMIGKAKEISEAYLQYTLQEVYGNETQLILSGESQHAEANGSEFMQAELPSIIDYESRVKVENVLSEANGWTTGGGEIMSVNFEAVDQTEESESITLKGGEMVRMRIHAVVHQEMTSPILGFLVRDKLGQDLFGENTLSFTQLQPFSVFAGETLKAEFIFRLPMLPNGNYSVMASLADGNLDAHVQHHWLHEAIIFHVASSKVRYGLVGIDFKNIVFSKNEET